MAEPKFLRELTEQLGEEDEARLIEALGVKSSKDLPSALLPYARAAAAEYVAMFTGRQVHSRMVDQEQSRLLAITEHALDGVLPNPDVVANLFQKNTAEAKTLLRNTATRYRFELSRAMNDAAWRLVVAAQEGETGWMIEVRDLALLEHIREAIRRGPGNPPGLQAKPDAMHVYKMDQATLKTLCMSLGRSVDSFEKERKDA